MYFIDNASKIVIMSMFVEMLIDVHTVLSDIQVFQALKDCDEELSPILGNGNGT